MLEVQILLIFLVAMLIQGASGFGSALTAMPFLITLVGIKVAAPLFLLGVLTAEIVMLVYFRHALQFREIWRLALAAAAGIPIGIVAIRTLPEGLVTGLLGIILIAYSLYSLLSPRPFSISRPGWGLAFGLVGGLLTGAYNTGGPPYVMYGAARQWDRDTFKSNIQGLFLISSLLAIANHALYGSFTLEVISHYLMALPGVLAGLALGIWLGSRINPQRFRQVILLLLIVIGFRLLFF